MIVVCGKETELLSLRLRMTQDLTFSNDTLNMRQNLSGVLTRVPSEPMKRCLRSSPELNEFFLCIYIWFTMEPSGSTAFRPTVLACIDPYLMNLMPPALVDKFPPIMQEPFAPRSKGIR